MPRQTRDLLQASRDRAAGEEEDTSCLPDEAWEGLTAIYRRMIHLLIFNERAVELFGTVPPFAPLNEVMLRQRDSLRDLMIHCRVAVPTFQRGVLAAPVPLNPAAAAVVARDELHSLVFEIDQLLDSGRMGSSCLVAGLAALRDACCDQMPTSHPLP